MTAVLRPLGGLLLVLGLALAGLAIAGRLPRVDLALDNWALSVTGFGLALAGFATWQRAPVFGLLVAALFIGGAAQLYITRPLWFPELKLRPAGGIVGLLPFLAIAAQAAIALAVHLRTGAIDGLKTLLTAIGPMRVIAFLILLSAFNVSWLAYASSGDYVDFAVHVVAAAVVMGINLLTILAMLRVASPIRDLPLIPILPLVAATFGLSVLMSLFGFERIPHVEDEVVYLFQARTFAAGALSAPAPADALLPGLEYYLLDVRDGQWLAVTPPGWTSVLSLGVLFGAPWLVNPVLGALIVLLAHGVVVRATEDRARADLVALLLATSPWLIGMSGSLMTHNITLFMMLLAWRLLLADETTKHRVALALIAGLAMGWAFLARQLEAAVVGTLTGLWLLRNFPRDLGRVVAYGIGCLLTASLFFAHNWALTGDPLLAPLQLYVSELWQEGANAYGFGPGIGPPNGWGELDLARGHSPFEGLVNTIHNLFILNFDTFGWGIGSLALLWAFLLYRRPDGLEWAMAAIGAAIITAVFFYWFAGSFYIGARYWYAAFLPLVVLSAGGYLRIRARLETKGLDPALAGRALTVLILFGLIVFTSWRGVAKYRTYADFRSDTAVAHAQGTFGNALVIVSTTRDIGAAFGLNDPFLGDDAPLFVMDLGDAGNAAMMAAMPDRDVIYFDADTGLAMQAGPQ